MTTSSTATIAGWDAAPLGQSVERGGAVGNTDAATSAAPASSPLLSVSANTARRDARRGGSLAVHWSDGSLLLAPPSLLDAADASPSLASAPGTDTLSVVRGAELSPAGAAIAVASVTRVWSSSSQTSLPAAAPCAAAGTPGADTAGGSAAAQPALSSGAPPPVSRAASASVSASAHGVAVVGSPAEGLSAADSWSACTSATCESSTGTVTNGAPLSVAWCVVSANGWKSNGSNMLARARAQTK